MGDALQAAYIDTVHLSDWRLIADAEGTDAAVLAEEVLVLLRVEEVLSHLPLPRQQAKVFRLYNSYPEAVSPADRAVASIRTCGEIEIGLEPHCSTMATTAVGLQHTAPRMNQRIVPRLMPELTRAEREAFNARRQDNDEQHGRRVGLNELFVSDDKKH